MDSVVDYVEFVNGQAAYHENKVRQLEVRNPKQADKHKEIAVKFRQLSTFLQSFPTGSSYSQEQLTLPSILGAKLPDGELAEAILNNPLELSPELLAGLPEDVLAEINISDTDRFEATVLRLINGTVGKTMLLDNILVGIYLMTKEKIGRTILANRLYRMSRKGKLYSVQGKKGFYTTINPGTAESIDPIQEGEHNINDLL